MQKEQQPPTAMGRRGKTRWQSVVFFFFFLTPQCQGKTSCGLSKQNLTLPSTAPGGRGGRRAVPFGPPWVTLDLWRATSCWVGHGAVSCSSLLLFQVAYPGHDGKKRLISLRNWAVYKINITSNIYYAQMTVQGRSSGCLCAEHQPPVRINCPVLGRNTIQFTRDWTAR